MAPPFVSLETAIYNLRTNWPNLTDDGEFRDWDYRSTVTYGVFTSREWYLDVNATVRHNDGYAPMTEFEMARARLAFELWDDVVALNLNESSDPDITLNHTSLLAGGGDTWTEEELWGTDLCSASIRVSATYNDADFSFGNYGFYTYLHEIGHSLGLTHPGDYEGSATYENDAEMAQDTRQYTVMSYFDAPNHSVGVLEKYPATPLLYDIAAMQAIYGPDMTTRTGDTVYGFNSNAGKWIDGRYFNPYDFFQNNDPVFAIWDAGGNDTLDARWYSTNQTINLGAGQFSSIGYLVDNIAIAFGATIENAIGGYGSDTIYGNSVANNLIGDYGDDHMYGRSGNDRLEGGRGNDRLYGYDEAQPEFVFDSDRDTLLAGDGNDILDGGPDADFMNGGDGNDTYYVDNTGDVVSEIAGFSAIGGSTFHTGWDTIVTTLSTYSLGRDAIENLYYGGFGSFVGTGNYLGNRVYGAAGNDRLYGGSGDDILEGGQGADTLDGDQGSDRLSGGAGADKFVFDAAENAIYGRDVIQDFGSGDVIRLDGLGISLNSFDALTRSGIVHNVSVNGVMSTVIAFDADTSLTLMNVTPDQLTAQNVLFGHSTTLSSPFASDFLII